MLIMQRSIFLILLINNKHFVIFSIDLGLNIVFYKTKFVYCFVIDNAAIKKVDHI